MALEHDRPSRGHAETAKSRGLHQILPKAFIAAVLTGI
jgi:hypothetical protein